MVEENPNARGSDSTPIGVGSEASFGRGIFAGVVAAVIGGIIWAVIVAVTNREIGFVAWGLGVLCGYAVLKLSGGGRGFAFQAVAVVTSIFGIIIGKYFTVYYLYKSGVESDYGIEAASSVSVFSGETASVFVSNLGVVFGGYDILWVVLAVASAWKIPGAAKE